VLLVLGAPALALLLHEQRLTSASTTWQRRVFLELPVIAEQLGMLLSAGYSLGAALNRLAARGRGACGQDLRRVCARVQYGRPRSSALREWAELVRVDGVDRLVAVLALNHEAGDLGRLIAEEAGALRRDAQRELIETIERRAQLVWIPVTVAALLPGNPLPRRALPRGHAPLHQSLTYLTPKASLHALLLLSLTSSSPGCSAPCCDVACSTTAAKA
jgi:tight adherence protein C